MTRAHGDRRGNSHVRYLLKYFTFPWEFSGYGCNIKGYKLNLLKLNELCIIVFFLPLHKKIILGDIWQRFRYNLRKYHL